MKGERMPNPQETFAEDVAALIEKLPILKGLSPERMEQARILGTVLKSLDSKTHKSRTEWPKGYSFKSGDAITLIAQVEKDKTLFGKAAIPLPATPQEFVSIFKKFVDTAAKPLQTPKAGKSFDDSMFRATWNPANDEIFSKIKGKIDAGEPLTQDDLNDLYEFDQPSQVDGFLPDGRLKRIQATRDLASDVAVMFECKREQVARTQDEIRPDTKVYIGPLGPHIFEQTEHVDRIYTAFPEGRIRIQTMEIGNRPLEDAVRTFADSKRLSGTAKAVFEDVNLPREKAPRTVELVFLTEKDIQDPDSDTRRADGTWKGHLNDSGMVERALAMGLEPCDWEVAPNYLLQGGKFPGVGDRFWRGRVGKHPLTFVSQEFEFADRRKIWETLDNVDKYSFNVGGFKVADDGKFVDAPYYVFPELSPPVEDFKNIDGHVQPGWDAGLYIHLVAPQFRGAMKNMIFQRKRSTLREGQGE